ncbi:MAG: sulfurtransferase, partial [Candidatus Kariarchaeaceae archaeon]
NSDKALYDAGHLPGALYLDWETQLNDPVRRTIVSREDLAKQLGNLGVDSNSKIVVYGDNNNWFAAFAYWILKLYGHEKVKILNGGRTLLELKMIPYTTDIPNINPTGYEFPSTENPELRAKRSDVLKNLGIVNLVDVRSPDEYTGKVIAPPGMTETAQRGGHIPTAINQPWSGLVKEDGTFKSYDEIKNIYTSKGITGDKPIIAYCRIGERSSHSWFALKELLGYDNVKNYDGSWTEYGNLIDVPISKGPEPGSIDFTNR